MNILFRDGGSDRSNQLINMIREKLNPEFSLICSIKGQTKNLHINGRELVLDYYEILEGKHDENSQIPPIDEKILLQLRPYYDEIFRSIGRNGALHYSYPKREELFLRTVRYWNWALDYYGIDIFLGFAVPHFSYEIIAYYLCKIKKIKTLFTWHTSIPGYMHFLEDIDEVGKEVVTPYTYLLEKYINEDIKTITLPDEFQKTFNLQTSLCDDRTPSYMKEKKSYKVKRRIKGLFGYYKFLKANDKNPFKGLVMKKFKSLDGGNYIKEYNKNVSLVAGLNKEKYIYVPLHLQPEATTCPLGGVYANQSLMVNMLAYYLPKGAYLYVKENPKQDNSERSRNFLDEMLKLENVRLVSMKEDTYGLIENSIAVATVTGTAAWEAIFRNKPAIVFGKHINRFAPGVITVKNNEDCIKAMEKIFNAESDDLLLKKIKIFMLALDEVSFKSAVLSEVYITDEKVYQDLKNTSDVISNRVLSI